MKHSFELTLLLSALAVCSAASCKSDDDGDDEDTSTENLDPAPIEGALGPNGRPETPAANRIDRAGRVAISAALISTFDPDNREADLDRYNKSGNANRAFIPIMATSLGVLDGLDNVCGNQLGVGPEAVPGRYNTLATALDDDQLYLFSDRPGTSSVYLGVEAEALGLAPEGGGSGGGRVPGDDVVRRSYSVLVDGSFGNIDDGVDRDDATHDIDQFPFLADPS
jgi:hypothetical protein